MKISSPVKLSGIIVKIVCSELEALFIASWMTNGVNPSELHFPSLLSGGNKRPASRAALSLQRARLVTQWKRQETPSSLFKRTIMELVREGRREKPPCHLAAGPNDSGLALDSVILFAVL